MTEMQQLAPGGLPHRIKAFFDANPDEELLEDDIKVKFGCTHKQLYEALNRLQAVRAIRVVRVIRRAA